MSDAVALCERCDAIVPLPGELRCRVCYGRTLPFGSEFLRGTCGHQWTIEVRRPEGGLSIRHSCPECERAEAQRQRGARDVMYYTIIARV